MRLIRDVLDNQLVDRRKVKLGKADGVIISDGVIVSDGVIISDAVAVAQSAQLGGDLTTTLPVSFDTGLDCLDY